MHQYESSLRRMPETTDVPGAQAATIRARLVKLLLPGSATVPLMGRGMGRRTAAATPCSEDH
jgi:hypothetical protein